MLEVRNLVKTFPVGKKRRVHAVCGVDLSLNRGEAYGIVGESGCGKTTLARCLSGLYRPDSGSILWNGESILDLSPARMMPFRRRVQYVFQDPYSSLDPRLRIGAILEEPLRIHFRLTQAERRRRVAEVLALVGLEGDMASRFPREFSGGQRQRISLARALVMDPEFLILDEPVSALDVSIQAQILNLLGDIRRKKGCGFILISHDLAVVRQICERVAVFYLGHKVEEGAVDRVLARPAHPYSRMLLDSLPGHRRKCGAVDGEVPSNIDPPTGCPFHPRCGLERVDACFSRFPDFTSTDGHGYACHLSSGTG